MSNNTLTVKNELVLENYSSNIEKLKLIDGAIDNFRGPDGELSSIEKEIFFNISCSDIYSPRYDIYLSEYIIVDLSCLFLYPEGYASLADMMA
mmetsp:Transcript_7311/g.6639  ORF Transcript_7311/g.6639 Transcript_7311/m.6639 type:complete len:93 (+) Transcript_7311:104-382(+)